MVLLLAEQLQPTADQHKLRVSHASQRRLFFGGSAFLHPRSSYIPMTSYIEQYHPTFFHSRLHPQNSAPFSTGSRSPLHTVAVPEARAHQHIPDQKRESPFSPSSELSSS